MTRPAGARPSLTVPSRTPGARMQSEMLEQPDVLARLVVTSAASRDRVRSLIPSGLAGVTLIARGSSRNAAVLGRYLIEQAARRPVSFAAPAVHTLYSSRVDHSGYVAIALSQSGATPEIATVLSSMRDTGASSVAVTNDPYSALAAAADYVYDLKAGPELAIPATKTVTAQLLGMMIIASAFGGIDLGEAELAPLPAAVRKVLNEPEVAHDLAARWVGRARRLVVVSRGYGYAAALEAALKLTETTGVPAQAFSSADLRHGPIAGISGRTPVLILDIGGPGRADLADLASALERRGAAVAWCSDTPDADLPLPAMSSEPLAALVAIVRAQQLALAFARVLDRDPDAPPGLSKVTETQ